METKMIADLLRKVSDDEEKLGILVQTCACKEVDKNLKVFDGHGISSRWFEEIFWLENKPFTNALTNGSQRDFCLRQPFNFELLMLLFIAHHWQQSD